MAKVFQKEKAQSLRRHGYSIGEIQKVVDASRSAISYWCRDIVLSSEQVKRLREKQKTEGLKKITLYLEKIRKMRLLNIKKETIKGKKDVGRIGERDFFIMGLALYWAEGYKKGNDEVGFTNSNPYIIKIMIKWFENFYGIHLSDFTLRVSINQIHKSRIPLVISYWSGITRISGEQFTKTSIIKTKSKKIYMNTHEHFGTLRIKVKRGTALRRRILGSLLALETIAKPRKKNINGVY